MANVATYAAETNGTITHLSGPLDSDLAAQTWHRELGNPGTLVVLDLAEGETPKVGDSIDIDAVGVATLCVTDDPEPEPLEYEVFDGNPSEVGGCGWPSISGSPDAEDYDDAQELATAVLEWAAGECDGNRDYSIGDTLYVIVRRPDGSQVQDSRTLELEDFDGSVSDVTEWEHVADYVACLYGTDGDQPGDCVVEIGKTPHGAWYVRHGDDGCKDEDEGPFATRDEAESRAQEWAEELNEACEGEDAEAMQARLLAERAGEPDEDGEYCVYWETAGDDEHVVERYESAEAAEAAAELKNQQLAAKHPGGNLLCGYSVRQLVDDEWTSIEER